jgi:HEAT repeat protein
LSSAKPNPDPLGASADASGKPSVNPGFESANPHAQPAITSSAEADIIRPLREFLSGRSKETPFLNSSNQAIRQIVAAELLLALLRVEDRSQSAIATMAHFDCEEQADLDARKRARELFIDHGFLDEVLQELRTADSAEKRAEAARTLGLLGSQRGSAPLIAALFDDAAEVRNAATEALSRVGDPSVSIDPLGDPLNALKEDETEWALPEIDSLKFSAPANVEASPIAVDTQPTESRVEMVYPLTFGQPSRVNESAAGSLGDEAHEPDPQTASLNSVSPLDGTDLLAKQEALRKQIEDLEDQLAEVVVARNQAEKEVLLRLDQESKFRADAAARRLEDEEARKRAEEKAARRRYEDERKLATEQLARVRVEEELHELATKEDRLRLECGGLKQAAEELARTQANAAATQQRAIEAADREELEQARRAAAERYSSEIENLRSEEKSLRLATEQAAVRRTEVEAARLEAEAATRQLLAEKTRLAATEAVCREEAGRVRETEKRNRAEQEELVQRVAELRRMGSDLVARRTEIDAASQRIEEETQRVLEAQDRIQAAEESRRLAQSERMQLEAEIRLQVDAEQRLLEEVRERAQAEAQRIAGAARLRVAEEEDRIKKEIEALRALEEEKRSGIEQEIRRRAETEMRLRQEKERLRLAEEARVKAEAHADLLARVQPARESLYEWHDDPAENLRRIEPPATNRITMALRVEASKAASEQQPNSVDLATTSDLTQDTHTKLDSTNPHERAAALAELSSLEDKEKFSLIVNYFDDPSPHVRNAAAKALRDLDPLRPVESFTRALEDASPERRRNIGKALAASGLAAEAINQLDAESREDTYNALCLLFVMAKSGEVQPLADAIEAHHDVEVRRAAIKLLNLSGQSEIAEAAAKRRLGLGERE